MFITSQTTATAHFYIEENIVYVEYLANVYHDKKVAKNCVAEFNHFIENNCLENVLLIVKSEKNAKFSLEARQVMASSEATKYVKSAAIVTEDMVLELTVKLFLKISTPDVPIRIFRNESAAITWLNE